ncbi:TVP38/TMEM64 family protein [Bacillus sp. DJP31]|uniref:TVP38/TMEM64 family protein n=1 Tax=Bacillus sp. DJP31 TaxID=3409789 RepID=UPI003BB52874
MSEFLIELLMNNKEISYLISILLNVLISIFAFIPSFFLTAANIYVYGFWEGTLLSLIGEVIGCLVSFWLYRKGIKIVSQKKEFQSPYIRRLLGVKGSEAFLLLLSLRLLPFMPSGLINIGAAFSKVSIILFGLSTLFGKIPALFLEGYTVSSYLEWDGRGKLFITITGIILFGIYICILVLKRRKNS